MSESASPFVGVTVLADEYGEGGGWLWECEGGTKEL
jgi:hypothetical protein